jgi:hypothetical protein
VLAVKGGQRAFRRTAQTVRLLQDRLEYQLEIARRGIDDLR